jgi:NDP-sugar pyrophosphorylase family protein
MKPIKVVIMCGGIGKRMAPITTDKALLKFSGKPLIIHQINSAREAGLSHFVLITNPKNNAAIQSALSEIKNAKIDFALQIKPLGMSDALLSSSLLIDSKPFILVSSNDVFDASAYTKLLQEYEADNGYSAYIIARPVKTYFPGGYLVVNEYNEIGHIVEKPPKGEEPSNLINIVIHLHTQPDKLLKYLANTTSAADDIYEKSLDQMIREGQKIKAVIYDGDWQAIKYPWHILKTLDYFSKQFTRQISTASHISDKATIDGNVIIGDNARVLEGAVIRGPTYIGPNTIIGNGALVRDSIIGNDCVVGYGTEIKHSYIGNKCWFHSNYIGDSIIEDDCSFGAGAVTANFRLDEANINVKVDNNKIDTGIDKLGAIVGKGCRIGIHASLMPGIKIGANSFIGSHTYLVDDVESGKKVLSESHYRVMTNDVTTNEDKRQELLKKLTL